MVAENTGNKKAAILAETLDKAIAMYLENGRLPSRKVHEIDNRGSTFYLALYWAQASATQTKDGEMQARFADVAAELQVNEAKISEELLSAQGDPADVGGYYLPDDVMAEKAMRLSSIQRHHRRSGHGG